MRLVPQVRKKDLQNHAGFCKQFKREAYSIYFSSIELLVLDRLKAADGTFLKLFSKPELLFTLELSSGILQNAAEED